MAQKEERWHTGYSRTAAVMFAAALACYTGGAPLLEFADPLLPAICGALAATTILSMYGLFSSMGSGQNENAKKRRCGFRLSLFALAIMVFMTFADAVLKYKSVKHQCLRIEQSLRAGGANASDDAARFAAFKCRPQLRRS